MITALGINFGLWGLSVIPAYLVVNEVGAKYAGFTGPDDSVEDETSTTATDGKKLSV